MVALEVSGNGILGMRTSSSYREPGAQAREPRGGVMGWVQPQGTRPGEEMQAGAASERPHRRGKVCSQR